MAIRPRRIHRLVPASASEMAKRVMLHTFKRKTGIDDDVDILTAQQLPVKRLPLLA